MLKKISPTKQNYTPCKLGFDHKHVTINNSVNVILHVGNKTGLR